MGLLSKSFALASCWAAASALPAWGAFHADFYSEQAYLSRENVIVNQVRVRGLTDSTAALVPYLQVGSELMTAGAGTDTLDPGASYAYAGPGARWTLGKVALFGELRARKFYTDRPSPQNLQHVLDARAVLVYGDYIDKRLGGAGSPASLFTEVYTEGVYTSADFNNLIFAGFARSGIRLQTTSSTTLDFFLEPFVTLDRVGHYYNNRADLKPSVRFLYFAGGFDLGLIGSYVMNTYFSRGTFDPNPYAGKPDGMRVLAVFGGRL